MRGAAQRSVVKVGVAKAEVGDGIWVRVWVEVWARIEVCGCRVLAQAMAMRGARRITASKMRDRHEAARDVM